MTWSSLVPRINNCLKLTHRPRRHPGSFSLCRTWTHAGDLDKDHSQWGADVKSQWFLLRNTKVSLSLFFFGIVSLFLISASLLMFSLSSLSQTVITSVRGFSMLIKKKILSLSVSELQLSPNSQYMKDFETSSFTGQQRALDKPKHNLNFLTVQKL